MRNCNSCDKEKNRDKKSGICGVAKGKDGLPVLCSGPWVQSKHYYLKRYCEIFSTGMKNKWDNRYFIDLFSGSGMCINNATEEEVAGSPLIALDCDFTHFIFAESNNKSLVALNNRAEMNKAGRSLQFIEGDINKKIINLIDLINDKEDSLFLVFADPYTIQLEMKTIETLTNARNVDLLIHFPYGTYFQRVLSQKNLIENTNRKISKFFGTSDWEDLHTFKVKPLIELYADQLKGLGYYIGDNFPNMKNSKEASLYYLIFASKNKRGLDFWRKTCSIESSGQRTFKGF